VLVLEGEDNRQGSVVGQLDLEGCQVNSFILVNLFNSYHSFIHRSLRCWGAAHTGRMRSSAKELARVLHRAAAHNPGELRAFAKLTDIQVAAGTAPVPPGRKATIFAPARTSMQSGTAQTIDGARHRHAQTNRICWPRPACSPRCPPRSALTPPRPPRPRRRRAQLAHLL
jgi:hypothetical protein